MSKKLGTIWEAPPHTIAKIAMVRAYLYVWLSILGARFRGQDLWYIDGFAGPGQYTNYADGSPIAALKAVYESLSKTRHWIAGTVHCVFMEQEEYRFTNLQHRLAEFPIRAGVIRHLFPDTFAGGVAKLQREAINPFGKGNPIFAFIDPFGAEGLAFATVRELLARPTCEVLVNFDSDGIARIYHAGPFANYRERLNEVFGDTDWERELAGVPSKSIAQRVLALYKKRLRALPHVRYVFAFEMRSKKNKIDYHLVFASQHPLGLEKMKEVMKQIAGDGSYSFSDEGDTNQTLFRYDDPNFHAQQLRQHFRGQTVSYTETNDYALNESPFANAKAMLKTLEKNQEITVTSLHARRKGTFPEHAQSGISIQFLQ